METVLEDKGQTLVRQDMYVLETDDPTQVLVIPVIMGHNSPVIRVAPLSEVAPHGLPHPMRNVIKWSVLERARWIAQEQGYRIVNVHRMYIV